MLDWPEREHYTAEDLIEILRILRDPETGCPWDRVQTHQSIRKNFLEETYEALEALDADDPAMLREELGDVLMQVAFHAVMEEERGRFDFEQVCREVCEKLVFRHPNIFASSATENAGINSWDEAALDRLPAELREVIILYYFQELKLTEISSTLQIGLPLVKYRVKQAKTHLERLLREE